MGIKVYDLVPGMVIENVQMQATFVAETQHPIWPRLRLVIWKLSDGTWSHDALDSRQDVGEALPSTEEERQGNLMAALLGRRS